LQLTLMQALYTSPACMCLTVPLPHVKNSPTILTSQLVDCAVLHSSAAPVELRSRLKALHGMLMTWQRRAWQASPTASHGTLLSHG
jgi:hypothetical protein